MTYQQAEQFLLSLTNIPRKEYMTDAKKTNTYIKRIQFLLDILGKPEKQIPHYIHVTGTSGKGSVSTFLHSILMASGKRSGITISPHPTHLLERWQVNNTIMSKKEFVEIVETLKPALERYLQTSPYDMVSFFDLTTVIALYYFAQKKVDYAVVEVGCGGRYDSTNVIPHKDVAVITNIGMDHADIIGPTKSDIAYEKSGIITKTTKAIFTIEQDKKMIDIIENECVKNKKNLHKIINPGYKILTSDLMETSFNYSDKDYSLSSLGTHQIKNAILCIEIAQSLGIQEAAIQNGLKASKQTLRMEIVSYNPLVIFDGAHNADKITSTANTIKDIQKLKTKSNLHIIVGFSADKDIPKMVKTLAQLHPKTVTCTRQTTNPFRKVAPPQDLQKLFKKYSPTTKTQIFLDPQEGLNWSQKQTKNNDILVVTGSIFLSGELKSYFLNG